MGRCGSCGSKRQTQDYEVTFRDGSKTVVPSQVEARILVQADTTKGDRAGTFRAVPKIAKAS